MTEKTYEMMWDCEYCGTKKLLGKTHRFCAECGAPQNPAKRYFPPDEEKVAVEDHQFVGRDVHCPACQEPQSAAVKHCANCGSPIAGGKAAATQADQVFGADGRLQQAAPPAAAKGSSKLGCIIGAIAVVIVCVIGFFIVNRFWTQAAELEVTKLTWKREIAIERFEEVEDKGPCKDAPKDAKIIKKSKAEPVCKTRKIDQGDGTFKEKKECTEPVEQCTYEVKKWRVKRTLKEEGGADDEPKWPESKVGTSKKECLGCEREGDRTESYLVHFKDTKTKDSPPPCSFSSKSKWQDFEKGSKWAGETGMLTGDIKCDKLKKAK